MSSEIWKDSFSEYEREEIRAVDMVYYLPTSLTIDEREMAAFLDYTGTQQYPTLLKGDQIEFRYRIEGNISYGGQGLVIKARDMMALDGETFVAIKLIAKDEDNTPELKALRYLKLADQSTLERWQQEGAEHVVQLLRTIEYRGWKALIFPLYGKSWHDLANERILSNSIFSLRELRKFTRDMLKALAYLKSIDVIHADLKPGNILLTGNSTESDSILVDFGNSYVGDGPRKNHFKGTLPFMPPEFLLRVGTATQAVDMWSLGASLYYLSTFQKILSGVKDRRFKIMSVVSVMAIRVPFERNRLNGVLIPRVQSLNLNGIRYTRVRNDLKEQAGMYASLTSTYDFNNFNDFLMKCLKWDTDERMTVEQALEHPFVTCVDN